MGPVRATPDSSCTFSFSLVSLKSNFFGGVGESPQSKVTSCGMHGNGRHNYHMCWCVQSGMMANVIIFVSLCKNLKMNLNHISFDHSTKFIPLVLMKYERMLDGDKDNM